MKYDVEDTDRGNQYKIQKVNLQLPPPRLNPHLTHILHQTLESYDADSHATVDVLLSLPTCTGRIGSTGMCLGGHLAVRAAVRPPSPLPPPSHHHPLLHLTFFTSQLDARITSCVAYFATDIHSRTLGPYTAADTSATGPGPDSNHTIDNLHRLTHCETSFIFGVKDTHVPPQGRDLIRSKAREAGVVASFHEFAWAQHAFIRDELSKGRYDPAVTKVCFEVLLEVFGRVLKTELGDKEGDVPPAEHVC